MEMARLNPAISRVASNTAELIRPIWTACLLELTLSSEVVQGNQAACGAAVSIVVRTVSIVSRWPSVVASTANIGKLANDVTVVGSPTASAMPLPSLRTSRPTTLFGSAHAPRPVARRSRHETTTVSVPRGSTRKSSTARTPSVAWSRVTRSVACGAGRGWVPRRRNSRPTTPEGTSVWPASVTGVCELAVAIAARVTRKTASARPLMERNPAAGSVASRCPASKVDGRRARRMNTADAHGQPRSGHDDADDDRCCGTGENPHQRLTAIGGHYWQGDRQCREAGD